MPPHPKPSLLAWILSDESGMWVSGGNSMNKTSYERLVAHAYRKNWWHVLPQDPDVYKKRGKFFASSFDEAEFYGRPFDQPEKVAISKPLVGDERASLGCFEFPHSAS
jgi:hypothetical protein